MPTLKLKKSLGVVGTRRCLKCGGLMYIKSIIGKKQSFGLPCTAQCTNCRDWFDCREPIKKPIKRKDYK